MAIFGLKTSLTSSLINIEVILEKKFLQKSKLNAKATFSCSVQRNSENIYGSNKNGIHFISLNPQLQILHHEIIQVENQDRCNQEFKRKVAASKLDPLIVVSMDKWENCLDWELINLLRLSPEFYDLRLLIGGRAGVGHAFVYFASKQQTFLKISHENDFIGDFKVSLGDFLMKIQESAGSDSGNNKIEKFKNDLLGRFAESKTANNSDYYNVSIDAEVNLNFTADQNITGSNKLYQQIKINVPKSSSSNTSSLPSLSSLNASHNSKVESPQNTLNNSNASSLSTEIKLTSNEIKGIKENSSTTSKVRQSLSLNPENFSQTEEKNPSKTLDIEMVSYGSRTTDTDFASIKINQQLIHASKSCGLHVAVIDPCKRPNFDENKSKMQSAFDNLTNFYDEIKFLYEKPLKIFDVSCFDTFRSANIVGEIFDFSVDVEMWKKEEERALINCPSSCTPPEKNEKF